MLSTLCALCLLHTTTICVRVGMMQQYKNAVSGTLTRSIGVFPCVFFIVTAAPALRSVSTSGFLPWRTAQCRAVLPDCSHVKSGKRSVKSMARTRARAHMHTCTHTHTCTHNMANMQAHGHAHSHTPLLDQNKPWAFALEIVTGDHTRSHATRPNKRQHNARVIR